jgi:phosphatidylinositol 3-kinase
MFPNCTAAVLPAHRIQELMLYLLQLVQSLKFESSASDTRSSRSTASAVSYDDSGLADFLVTRAVKNHVLGYRLYWYLTVEVALEDRQIGKMYAKVIFNFRERLQKVWVILLSLS